MQVEEIKAVLQELSVEDLKSLQQYLNELIILKYEVEKKEYTFTFNATEDRRKGAPYVAKLILQDGKIQREFYQLDRSVVKNDVSVWGEFTAKKGDVIEMRKEASWNNDGGIYM
ncbi:MAG: hypothetical protein QXZ59_06555 [Nitrososphaeria archaeon]